MPPSFSPTRSIDPSPSTSPSRLWRATVGIAGAMGCAAVAAAALSVAAAEPPAASVVPAAEGPATLAPAGVAAPRVLAASATAPAAATDARGLAGLPFVPFHHKRGEWLGAVRLGLWPAERRPVSDPAYRNPDGFYVVTEALRAHAVSPHFTLGEFAMRDGREGTRGPDGESYLALDPRLLDKLERILGELAARGIPARDLRILSAFRAPRYNAGVEGAAPSSRHQFGDAADVVVDSDGDGRMDDLNADGRVDRADARLVAEAVERVERAWPALAGGLGLYDAQGPSGPFLHVDVRGRAARWGAGAPPAAGEVDRPWLPSPAAAPPPVPAGGRRPTCRAAPGMEALCAPRREPLRRGS